MLAGTLVKREAGCMALAMVSHPRLTRAAAEKLRIWLGLPIALVKSPYSSAGGSAA